MISTRVGFTLICLGLMSATCSAQLCGVPGDGIPDFYYFAQDGTVETSLGTIFRPAGTLTVDTDGSDLVAMLVGGPEPLSCDLCDGGFLPDPNAGPFLVSSWTYGYIAEAAQWVRTSPLNTLGFMGVIGEYDNPNGLFPEFGLANYGPGLSKDDFTRRFEDDSGEFFSVAAATSDDGTFFANVSVIPEPAMATWFLLAMAGTLGRIRRRQV